MSIKKLETCLEDDSLSFHSGEDWRVVLQIGSNRELKIFTGTEDFFHLDHCIVVDSSGLIRPGSGDIGVTISPGDTIFLCCSSGPILEDDPDIIGYYFFIVLRIIEGVRFHPKMSSLHVPIYSKG